MPDCDPDYFSGLVPNFTHVFPITSKQYGDCFFLRRCGAEAYENLPLRPPGAPWAAISLCDEARQSWSVFLRRTLMFGDTASVLRCDIFPHLLFYIVNLLFGTPIIAFYDGMGPPVLGISANCALRVVREVFPVFGLMRKHPKCDFGNPLSLLGLTGCVPKSTESLGSCDRAYARVNRQTAC